ncbi:MAG TPA: tetratricopeptide repeat protein [Verrucomicrobiae bacterium]|nr:tetratricopeptide repeat protein [Verrucomicrobiae bacterium]
MSKYALISAVVIAVCGSLPASKAQSTPAGPDTASAERALALAGQGRCREALPVLKKAAAQSPAKTVRYDLLMATARCAMSVERTETTVQALVELNRDFAHDPEVLYITTHFYSELASRAAQELADSAPTSPQAEQLEAEAYESHNDWDSAATEYKKILEQNPRRHGIHYQLGRILLLKSPPDPENARKEFEQELNVDPASASAEFMLGETARQAGQWDEAIARFTKASEFDVGFDEAYLALGMSLNSAGKFAEAVSPLETYVKREPGDPAGHYQLATAYARTGRKEQAEKEMQLQRAAAAKAPRDAQ